MVSQYSWGIWGCHGDWTDVFHGQIRRILDESSHTHTHAHTHTRIKFCTYLSGLFSPKISFLSSAKMTVHCQVKLMCVTASWSSLPTTVAVVFSSQHLKSQLTLYCGVLALTLLSYAHSATPTLPPQVHSSTRSGSRLGVLLYVSSHWMRLMWVLWLIHQTFCFYCSRSAGR